MCRHPHQKPGFAHPHLRKDKKGKSLRKLAGRTRQPVPGTTGVQRPCAPFPRLSCALLSSSLCLSCPNCRDSRGRMITFFRGEIKGSVQACRSVPDEVNFPTSVPAACLPGGPAGCHGSCFHVLGRSQLCSGRSGRAQEPHGPQVWTPKGTRQKRQGLALNTPVTLRLCRLSRLKGGSHWFMTSGPWDSNKNHYILLF